MSRVYFPMDHSPAEWREMAGGNRRRSAESFERCDTDGFLTQHTSDLFADLYDTCASIAEEGGTAEVDAFFDLKTGEELDAKIYPTRFGSAWRVVRPGGDVVWVGLLAKPGTLQKKGVEIRKVRRPVFVCIEGRGRGLSGTTWVEVKPFTRRMQESWDAERGGK